MINFSAFLGAATMYTRYKIVEKQNQTSYFSTPVFNLVSLVLGLVGCIGMGIVANFQVCPEVVCVLGDDGVCVSGGEKQEHKRILVPGSRVSCPRGPRWRCPLGFCLRCGLHAPAVHHLLQIMSPVEQPVHMPRAAGHLCCFLCSRGPHDCLCFINFYNQAGVESQRKGLYISRSECNLRMDSGLWFHFLLPNIHPRFPECHPKNIHRNQ
ncbi:DNA damage-regulated autophagy modulator protein 1 isoform X3 [Mirounga angustirostris]